MRNIVSSYPQSIKRTRDLCSEFGVSPVTIWRWERDGILPKAKKINRQKTWDATVKPKFDDEVVGGESYD